MCGALTAERRRALASREVMVVGRPLRIILAAGGAYMFYYGTSGDEPLGLEPAANLFAAVGIAGVLLAIFLQKIVEVSYFTKALRAGCFPREVSVGEGGLYIVRMAAQDTTSARGETGAQGARSARGAAGKNAVTSVNAERYVAFSEIGAIEDNEVYFKVHMRQSALPVIFIFKEDFGQGEPEAFIPFISSKQ
jgi:hypothetical protein